MTFAVGVDDKMSFVSIVTFRKFLLCNHVSYENE